MRVYPVPGRYRQGVPHVEHDCDDPECLSTGAFTTEPPEAAADEPEPDDSDATPTED